MLRKIVIMHVYVNAGKFTTNKVTEIIEKKKKKKEYNEPWAGINSYLQLMTHVHCESLATYEPHHNNLHDLSFGASNQAHNIPCNEKRRHALF